MRALKAMGSQPAAWHLNEGHAAFVVLQRIRDLIEHGQSFDAALEEVRRTTIFTTHTPVPAGHDAFPFHLVETHLANAWGTLGPYRDAFLALGHYDNGSGPLFNMTALALRTAGATNAVSQVHRQVTRDMWAPIWPGVPDNERPVRAITNGIHVPTWLSAEMTRLLDDHLDAGWRDRHDDPAIWNRILEISDEDLWGARQALRNYLFAFIRERARSRWKEEHVTAARVVAAGTLLDPNALTIGFARRFTGYKRSELIFRNPDRLLGILNAARRPVQIIFAGKAHPADETGKHHLQQVYKRATDPMFAGRVAFVDDYDLHVAHFLVQGCDVWLNNPRKPLEASGTSGMKASINGVPQVSIADGWWAEGYTGQNGWLIESHPESGDYDAVDAADAEALYQILEREVVPTFYDRDRTGHSATMARCRAPGDAQRDPSLQRTPHGQAVRRGDVRAGRAPARAAAAMNHCGLLECRNHRIRTLDRQSTVSIVNPQSAKSAVTNHQSAIRVVQSSPCPAKQSSRRVAPCAAPRKFPSLAAKNATAATAGTRRLRSKRSSRANSR